MSSKTTIALAVSFLLSLSSAACPIYSCISMPANQCGNRLSGTSFQVSSTDVCTQGNSCSLMSYLAWELGSSSVFLCTQTPVANSTTAVAWTYAPCLTQVANRTWNTGGSVVYCHSDSDCLYVDGTYSVGSCVCVPRTDGQGVCNPSPSNTAMFPGYWSTCAGQNNRIQDKATYDYFNYAFNYWVYTQSNLNCSSTFYELQVYTQLNSSYSAAEAVGLATLWVVSTLFY